MCIRDRCLLPWICWIDDQVRCPSWFNWCLAELLTVSHFKLHPLTLRYFYTFSLQIVLISHIWLHFVVPFKYLLASNLYNVQFARKMLGDWEWQYGAYFPSGRVVAHQIYCFWWWRLCFLRCSDYVWRSLSDVYIKSAGCLGKVAATQHVRHWPWRWPFMSFCVVSYVWENFTLTYTKF